jgi:hypothetical protein
MLLKTKRFYTGRILKGEKSADLGPPNANTVAHEI